MQLGFPTVLLQTGLSRPGGAAWGRPGQTSGQPHLRGQVAWLGALEPGESALTALPSQASLLQLGGSRTKCGGREREGERGSRWKDRSLRSLKGPRWEKSTGNVRGNLGE